MGAMAVSPFFVLFDCILNIVLNARIIITTLRAELVEASRGQPV
jgi:hypothetical protein